VQPNDLVVMGSLRVVVASPPTPRSDEEEGSPHHGCRAFGIAGLVYSHKRVLTKPRRAGRSGRRYVSLAGFIAHLTTAADKERAYICWTIASSMKLAIAGKVDPAQLARSCRRSEVSRS
jgi:hypothetical protein